MTKKEFDKIKEGDVLTNKHTIDDREQGYDYVVTYRTPDYIELKDTSMGSRTLVYRDEVEMCMDLRFKDAEKSVSDDVVTKIKEEISKKEARVSEMEREIKKVKYEINKLRKAMIVLTSE